MLFWSDVQAGGRFESLVSMAGLEATLALGHLGLCFSVSVLNALGTHFKAAPLLSMRAGLGTYRYVPSQEHQSQVKALRW